MLSKLIPSRPMHPRDTSEVHRAATPLELLFDLVSVIAIAAAAAGLHHAIAEAHFGDGLLHFVAAFFMVWWAWMNYSWFASAYDNDDAPFRLLTLTIMAGALALAAGISHFFANNDLRLALAGFLVMRVAMIALWLRAAWHHSAGRMTALWYAGGIALVQLYWIVIVTAHPSSELWFWGLFGLGVLFELSVPALAEKQGATPWHRHHMIERYGLLNIIVLGETLLAGSMALSKAAGDHFDIALIEVAVAALVILFSLWWLYFSSEDHLQSQSSRMAFIWGYGHVLIFMAGAGVGAGFAAIVDVVTHHAHISLLVAQYSVAIPAAMYLLGLWFVRDRFALDGVRRHVLPVFALLMLAVPPLLGLSGLAALSVLAVVVRSYCANRQTTA